MLCCLALRGTQDGLSAYAEGTEESSQPSEQAPAGHAWLCARSVALTSLISAADSSSKHVKVAQMGKKGKGGGGRDFWDGLSGWKAVDVGDALLLGSEEYGFCGLEELDGSTLGECLAAAAAPHAGGSIGGAAVAAGAQAGIARVAHGGFKNLAFSRMHSDWVGSRKSTPTGSPPRWTLHSAAAGDLVIPADGAAAPPAADEQQQPQQKQQKGKKRKELEAGGGAAASGEQPDAAAAENKSKKQKGKDAKKGSQQGKADDAGAADGRAAGGEPGAAGDAESVAALKAQLAVLSAENKQLKRQQKKEARLEKRAAAAAQRKEERAARRAAAAEAAAAAAAAAAEAAARVDISAWKDLQLSPSIEEAIAALGFEAPTHVQAECLPAAIRDRRDVIGAAQTGSGKTLAFGLPIMQLLLQERGVAGAAGSAAGGTAEGGDAANEGGAAPRQPSKLRALILAPTRELALQVCDHLQVRRAGVADCGLPQCVSWVACNSTVLCLQKACWECSASCPFNTK